MEHSISNWFSDFLPKDPAARRKLKRTIWWAVAVVLFLQLYFVRELIVLELLFGVGFAVFFAIALAIYGLSRAGERGMDLAEPYAQKVGELTKEGFSASVDAGKRGVEWAGPFAVQTAERGAKELGAFARWSAAATKRGMIAAGPYLREAGVMARWLWREMVRYADRGIETAGPLVKKFFNKSAELVRRGWVALEAISKKPFRHQRSESAR
jgi:hypothetical protein